jgi:hypothetical protein
MHSLVAQSLLKFNLPTRRDRDELPGQTPTHHVGPFSPPELVQKVCLRPRPLPSSPFGTKDRETKLRRPKGGVKKEN